MKDINLFQTKDSIFLKKVKSKTEVSKDEKCDGFLIDSSEKEARRIIESLRGSGKKIAIQGGDDAFNRRAIESLRVDYLVSPEGKTKRDNLKQRDSGINHVIAKLAKRKNISIVINIFDIKKLKKEELALRMSKILQNIKICRKAGCEIRIASFGSKESEVIDELGRRAFGESLGMSSQQSNHSIKT